MNTHTFFIVLFVCCSLVICGEVTYKDCGSVSGKVNHVDVTGCSTSKCVLHKGTNSTITISFVPKGVVTSVKASVHGIIGGIPIPFPLSGADGCKDSGLTCPLKGGVEVKYHKNIEVLSSYPSLKLVVKWELMDENKKDLVCIDIAAQIEAEVAHK